MIVDAHTHAFPDFLAEHAINTLAGDITQFARPSHDGTVSGLLAEMDRAGVDRAVLCSIATAPGQTRSIIMWNEKLLAEQPRLVPLPSVHPGNDDPPALLEEIKAKGFKGIKLHPMFQQHALDSEAYAPICAAAAALGLVIVFHTGFDLNYPTDDAASPRRLARVLDRCPGLRVMATHLGGWRAWEDVDACLAGRENVYMGTSFAFGFVSDDLWDRITTRHTWQRIMFGTDSPWLPQDKQIAHIKALGLDPADEAAVLGANAVRFFGLKEE